MDIFYAFNFFTRAVKNALWRLAGFSIAATLLLLLAALVLALAVPRTLSVFISTLLKGDFEVEKDREGSSMKTVRSALKRLDKKLEEIQNSDKGDAK